MKPGHSLALSLTTAFSRVGRGVDKARELFWSELSELVKANYDMKPIQAVDKYSIVSSFAFGENKGKLVSEDNYIVRIEIEKISDKLVNYSLGGGLFFEYVTEDVSDIIPVLNKKCQTVSVLGIDKEKVLKIALANGVRGVDRIVPLGETMALEFVWDGYKMIEEMSRFIYSGEY